MYFDGSIGKSSRYVSYSDVHLAGVTTTVLVPVREYPSLSISKPGTDAWPTVSDREGKLCFDTHPPRSGFKLCRGIPQGEQGDESAAAAAVAAAGVDGDTRPRSIDECAEQRERLREVLEVKTTSIGDVSP